MHENSHYHQIAVAESGRAELVVEFQDGNGNHLWRDSFDGSDGLTWLVDKAAELLEEHLGVSVVGETTSVPIEQAASAAPG